MGPVYRKRSQIESLLRRLDEVNGGAFIFKLALLGLIPFVFLYADDGRLPAVVDSGEAVVDINGTVVASVDGNGTVASVDGNGTNIANVPMEKEIPAGLGSFSVIPRKDPFRLIKPEPPPKEEPTIVTPPRSKGPPHLAGISTLNGVNRVLLRVSPPRGGPAEFVFLEEGVGSQAYDGWIKVVKIDVEKGQAQVLVDEQTFDLELDSRKDPSLVSSRDANATSTLRPTGKNYTFLQPEKGTSYSGRGSSSSGRGSSVSDKKGSTPSRGLKPVPGRNRTKNSLEFLKPFGSEMYEKPAFDLRMQRSITDPAQLSIQREIIRGQYSREVPTDLPAGER